MVENWEMGACQVRERSCRRSARSGGLLLNPTTKLRMAVACRAGQACHCIKTECRHCFHQRKSALLHQQQQRLGVRQSDLNVPRLNHFHDFTVRKQATDHGMFIDISVSDGRNICWGLTPVLLTVCTARLHC